MSETSFYLLLFAAGVATLESEYHQIDYNVVSERFELIGNERYISNVKYVNFKYNRTFHAVNASAYFKIDFNNDVKVYLQAYRFASNEYRLFPLQFEENVCSVLTKNTFGLHSLYSCGHAPRCPVKKGNYSICKWQPDYTKFPPYIPTGSYRLDLNFSYFSDQIAYAQWYGTVKRDLAQEKMG